MNRTEELSQNLGEVNQRIKNACELYGRSFDEITLIAVSKTWPASDIAILHSLGVKDFGESRDQEAVSKVAELSNLEITWHFIGQLQTNKLNSIAAYADLVHAVDREKVIKFLESACEKNGRHITALLQVSLDGDTARGGVSRGEVVALAELISECGHLTFGGLMAVAPLGVDPDAAFSQLSQVSINIQRNYPEAKIISAGMSGDLEMAVKNGATHLRIGSDLLGKRA